MELELKHPYLGDENEREDLAKYYVNEFGENTELKLQLIVGPYKDKSLNDLIDSYVRSKLKVLDGIATEKGFFKKTTYVFKLDKQKVTYEYMLSISNVILDLILSKDLKVDVVKV